MSFYDYFITGSDQNPGYCFASRVVEKTGEEDSSKKTLEFSGFFFRRIQLFHFFPGVSTVSGLSQAAVSVVYTIHELALACMDRQEEAWKKHLGNAGLGLRNFFYGIVVSVPIVGNVIHFAHLIYRGTSSKLKIENNLQSEEAGSYILFSSYTNKANLSSTEYSKEKLQNLPFEEILEKLSSTN